jgi:hypothetical protein
MSACSNYGIRQGRETPTTDVAPVDSQWMSQFR